MLMVPARALLDLLIFPTHAPLGLHFDSDDTCRCAVYLGSSQFDPHAERDVFAGKYIFVYVTPEKLASVEFC
jgi:hypothetical protein